MRESHTVLKWPLNVWACVCVLSHCFQLPLFTWFIYLSSDFRDHLSGCLMSGFLLRHSFSLWKTCLFSKEKKSFFWLFIHLTLLRSKRHVKTTHFDNTMTLLFSGNPEKKNLGEKNRIHPLILHLAFVGGGIFNFLIFPVQTAGFWPQLEDALPIDLLFNTQTHTHRHIPCVQ